MGCGWPGSSGLPAMIILDCWGIRGGSVTLARPSKASNVWLLVFSSLGGVFDHLGPCCRFGDGRLYITMLFQCLLALLASGPPSALRWQGYPIQPTHHHRYDSVLSVSFDVFRFFFSDCVFEASPVFGGH
jgi:hypothetical protein